MRAEAKRVEGVKHVSEVRVRWLGHRMPGEVNLTVAEGLTVEEGHDIATRARHSLLHNLNQSLLRKFFKFSGRRTTKISSTRRPSISTTSNRNPAHSKRSTTEGMWPRYVIMNPPTV